MHLDIRVFQLLLAIDHLGLKTNTFCLKNIVAVTVCTCILAHLTILKVS